MNSHSSNRLPFLVRLLSTRFGLWGAAAPAYLALFIIHLRNSLPALRAEEVPPDLGYSPAASAALQLLQILCFAYLFAIYGVALAKWRTLGLSVRDAVWNVAAVGLMAWTLLPANSSDALDYIGFGRMVAVYHVSPYEYSYSEFTDHFAGLVTWDEPMPYGPVVLPVFAAVGVVSQYSTLAAVYAIKFVWLIVFFANVWLIYLIADSLAVNPAFALVAFAFNPLMVVEQVGNGHNDGLMVFFGLLAILLLQRGRERPAVWLAMAAALVKTPGALALAGVVAVLIQRRRFRPLIQALAAGAIIVPVLLWLLPGCIPALTVLNSQWQYSEDSLHTLLIEGISGFAAELRRSVDYEVIFSADRIVSSTLFAAICVWRYCRVSDVATLVRELGRLTLLLLLGYAASVYPWYVSWVVPFAALTDSAGLRRSILATSAALVMLYAVPFGWLDQAPAHALWSALRLCAAFLIPVVIWASSEVHAASLARDTGLESSPIAI